MSKVKLAAALLAFGASAATIGQSISERIRVAENVPESRVSAPMQGELTIGRDVPTIEAEPSNPGTIGKDMSDVPDLAKPQVSPASDLSAPARQPAAPIISRAPTSPRQEVPRPASTLRNATPADAAATFPEQTANRNATNARLSPTPQQRPLASGSNETMCKTTNVLSAMKPKLNRRSLALANPEPPPVSASPRPAAPAIRSLGWPPITSWIIGMSEMSIGYEDGIDTDDYYYPPLTVPIPPPVRLQTIRRKSIPSIAGAARSSSKRQTDLRQTSAKTIVTCPSQSSPKKAALAK
jgi:hypothetical protein